MTLTSDLQGVKNRVQPLLTRFGVHTYLNDIKVVTAAYNALTGNVDYTNTVIAPKPKVRNVPASYVGMAFSDGTIQVREADLLVSNVSRTYPHSLFTNNVHVVEVTSPHLGTVYCDILHVDDRKALGWTLILRVRQDRHNG